MGSLQEHLDGTKHSSFTHLKAEEDPSENIVSDEAHDDKLALNCSQVVVLGTVVVPEFLSFELKGASWTFHN